MNKVETIFLVYLFAAGIFMGAWAVTYYYPNHPETITVEKAVADDNQWILVTTDGTPYNINFETYAIIDAGKTYTGVVTHPFLGNKYIDHLVEVPS